jgi:hypothetical protein
LYDGDGTASDLQIASNKVKVSTELYIGSKTATEFIQDIVGSMFTTGSYTNITTTYDDTNGNIDLSASGEVTLTGTQTLTNKTLADPTFTGTANGANLTLTGDLTVSGDTIFTNSNTVLIGDAILTLNADETGSPTANAGFEVERGTSTNKTFIWNETDDKWTIGSETFVASTVEANLTGNVTGNVTGSASLNLLKSSNLSDLASASTARSNLGVDAAGTDNSTNVTLAGSLDYITLSGQEITRNAINLGTDVTSQLPIVNGGTGASDANTARENLGLEIGLDVQAYDAGLLSIATLTTSANKMIYTTASDTYATTTLSSTARTLLDDNTTADMLTTLGLTATATELNYTDGVTSNIQTQLNGKLGTSAKAADSELLDGINSTSFVQTSRSITPVSQRGISGGGDLSADRTIELSASQLGSVALTTSDQLILFDQSDSDIPKRFNAQDIFDTISGAVTIYSNTGDNRVLTSGGGTTINGESNLTFDGSTLALTGTLTSTGHLKIADGQAYMAGGGEDVQLFHSNLYGGFLFNQTNDFYFDQVAADKDWIFRVDDSDGGGDYQEVMRIQGSTKNVGIGTNSPDYELDVAGDIGVDHLITHNSDSNTYVQFTNDRLRFAAGGEVLLDLFEDGTQDYVKLGDGGDVDINLNDDMFVQGSSGNVGIGTNSPSNTLEVKSSSSTPFAIKNASNSTRLQVSLTNDDADIFLYDRNTTLQTALRSEGDSYFNQGNVGIGTTSPGNTLQVSGSGSTPMSSERTTNSGGFAMLQGKMGDSASTTAGHVYSALVAGIEDNTNGAEDGYFAVEVSEGGSGSEKLRIKSNGNVGIGVTSPSFSYGSLGLEIQSTGDTSLRLERDGSTAFEISARSSDILIYNPGTARNFRFGLGGTEEFRMDTSGNFHADADVIAFSTTTASDIKFKENVKSIPYGLKEVLQMNPVEFDWIEKRNGTHDIGFIAQEMEKIVPEVIKETETLEVGGTHKTMDYAKLTSILVQAIQEQQQQINELKEKLNG